LFSCDPDVYTDKKKVKTSITAILPDKALFYNLLLPIAKKLFICFLERYKLVITGSNNDPTYTANVELAYTKCPSLTFINASTYHIRPQSLFQHRVIKGDFLAQ